MSTRFLGILLLAVGTIVMLAAFLGDGGQARTLIDEDAFTGSDGDAPNSTRWTVIEDDSSDSVDIHGNALRCSVDSLGQAAVLLTKSFGTNNFTMLLDWSTYRNEGRPLDVRLVTNISGTLTQMLTLIYDPAGTGWTLWTRVGGTGGFWYSNTRNVATDTWYSINITVRYDSIDFSVTERSSGSSKFTKSDVTIDALRSDNKLKFGTFASTMYSPASHYDNYALYANDGPLAPSGLTPGNGTFSATTPKLGWTFSHPTPGEKQAKYQLQLADVVSMAAPRVDTGIVTSGQTSYQPEALPTGRWYWRVRVADSSGAWSPWSAIVYFTMDDQPPGAPGTPWDGGEWTNTSMPSWSWSAPQDASDVAGYYVCIGTSPVVADFVQDRWVNTTSYKMPRGVSGKTYYCRVKAADIAQNVGLYSPWSDGITVDLEAPSVVYFIDQDDWTSDEAMVFRWAEAEEDISGIRYYEGYAGSTAPGTGITSPWFTHSTEIWGRGVDGEQHWVIVRAVDNAGNCGAWLESERISVDRSPPTAPIASDEADFWRWPSIVFGWSAANDFVPDGGLCSGMDHYLVDVGTYQGGSDAVRGAEVWGLNYTFSGARDGMTYYCRVRAVDAVGNVGPYGQSSDGVLVDMQPPSVAQAIPDSRWVTATVANWSFSPARDDGSGVAAYKAMLRRQSGGDDSFFHTWWTLDPGDLVLTLNGVYVVTFGNLDEGETYYLYIASVDRAGNIGYAHGEPSPTTVDLRVGAPTAVLDEGAWSDDSVLVFTWSPVLDQTSGIRNYRVHLGTTPESDDVLAGLAVDGTTLTYTAGVDGRTYYLRVVAVDNAGNIGKASAPTDGITVDLAPPQSVGVADAGEWSAQVVLTFTWEAPAESDRVALTHVAVGAAPGMPSASVALPGLAQSYDYAGAIDGASYYCWVWFEDLAGNVGTPGAASDGIMVDLTPPSRVEVSVPGSHVREGPITFAWDPALDASSGVEAYEVALYGGPYLGYIERVTVGTYSLVDAEAGVGYHCRVRAIDRARNVGEWSDPSSTVLVYPGAPNVTMSLDGGVAVTRGRAVTVHLTVRDIGPVDFQMRVAEGVSLGEAPWEPYQGTFTFLLSGADGPHTLIAEVLNGLGVVGNATATITLDTTAPALSVDAVDGTETRSQVYGVRGTTEPGASLTCNGVAVAVAPDGTFSLDARLVLGGNSLTLVATDPVGNSVELTVTIYREPVPEYDWTPVAVGFSLAAFLVALVVLLLLVVYLVRRKAAPA